MKRFVVVLLFAVASDAYCGSILPNIEDTPIVSRMFEDPKAAEAAQKSQKAFLIQSGISNQYNLMDKGLSKVVGRYAAFAKDDVEYFFNEYTIIDPKYVFFTATTAYIVIVKKEYTYKTPSPFVPRMTHSFTLGQNHGAVGVGWTF